MATKKTRKYSVEISEEKKEKLRKERRQTAKKMSKSGIHKYLK